MSEDKEERLKKAVEEAIAEYVAECGHLTCVDVQNMFTMKRTHGHTDPTDTNLAFLMLHAARLVHPLWALGQCSADVVRNSTALGQLGRAVGHQPPLADARTARQAIREVNRLLPKGFSIHYDGDE